MISISFFDVLIGLLCLLLYLYFKREIKYFKRNSIKTEKMILPLAGHLLESLVGTKHYTLVIKEVYDACPNEKYFGFMNFRSPIIVVKDLELIKKITIKDFDHFADHLVFLNWDTDPMFGQNLFHLEGQKWREMRPTLSPAFTSSKMKGMFQFIAECAQQMTSFFEEEFKKEEFKDKGIYELELKDMFTRIGNDIIATCAFGIKVDSLKCRDNEFYRHGLESTNFSGVTMLKLFFLSAFPKLAKLIKMPVVKEDTRSFLKNVFISSMRTREEEKIVRHDMIHLLMEAKKGSLQHSEADADEKDKDFSVVQESSIGKAKTTKSKWTDIELVAQAVVFFVGGFDTTASNMSFMAYELAVNQDIQRRLQQEIDQVLETGREVTYSDVQGMKYMDMVVSETLRYWPIVIRTDRKCVKPYTLPPPNDFSNQEFKVEKGRAIWIPVHSIHHDPRYYENPEKFDPERFSDENKWKINPLTYLPFGVGPRNCIGSRFALMETKIVMFFLLSKFDLVPTPKTDIPLPINKKLISLSPENGFWIGLRPRQK